MLTNNRRRGKSALLLLLLPILSLVVLPGQATAAEISGKAVDGNTDIGVGDVIVTVREAGGKELARTNTSNDGAYRLKVDHSGDYNLEFTKIAYTLLLPTDKVTVQGNSATAKPVHVFPKKQPLTIAAIQQVLESRVGSGDREASLKSDLQVLNLTNAVDPTVINKVAQGLSVDPSFLVAKVLPDISIEELKRAMLARKVTVLDVNDAATFAAGHIPGAVAVAVARENLAAKLPADKSALIVTYAKSPSAESYAEAAKAAKTATDLGYTNVKHLSAGLVGWKATAAPVDKD
jgi:rhodanese-related sulfurtransferase